MEYKSAFENFAKALAPNGGPSRISVPLDVEQAFKKGTVGGFPSDQVIDHKDHFPIITEIQARSSMNRAMSLREVPAWYAGTIDDLRYEIYAGIVKSHPDIEDLKVSLPIDQVIALSDGEEAPETSRTDIKDPVSPNKDEVPPVKRPTLNTAASTILAMCSNDEELRQTVATSIADVLQKQKERLDQATVVASRLLKKGLSSDEFSQMPLFVQEEVLHDLMRKGVIADDQRRSNLLERMSAGKDNPFAGPIKPTDGGKKKKKKKDY